MDKSAKWRLFSKKFHVGINLLVGLVMGYILGFFKMHIFLTFLPRISIDFSWLSWLGRDTEFLSDIAAVESVLIGVSMPMSIQIVSWVANRYKDQDLSKFFTDEKLYKAQYYLFLPNIVIAILLKFLAIQNIVVLGVIWIWFAFNVIVFWFFLKLIQRYAVDTDHVFIEKYEKVFKISSNEKTDKATRQRFFFLIEKVTNIALVMAELGNTKSLRQILNEIEKIFRQFWSLRQSNPNKFEAFLWSEDYYERFVKSMQVQEAEVDSPVKNAEELKTQANFWRSIIAGREMKGLTLFLKSYEKIWEGAYKNGNDEITNYVVYQVEKLLSELVQEKDNQLFIEQFLRLLNSISVKAIKESGKTGEIELSAYAAATDWYIGIVFNQEGFDLSYLGLFDKFFLSIVRYIVAENHASIFQSLISSLVDGINVPDYRGEVWNYMRIILNKDWQKYKRLDTEYGIEKHIEDLVNSENDLYTKEKLESWLNKFNDLKKVILPYLDEEQHKEAQKIEEKIRKFAISQFKYQNLLEIVFEIGAYCLFKQRYGYIKYLWEYKQPPDSDAFWIGIDITPKTLDEVIQFYFRKGSFERGFDFWEGHHGSEKYYEQYFLLLLARILQSIPADAGGRYSQIENYKLSHLHIYKLSDLEHSMDNFVTLAVDLKQDANMLAEIGFDTTKLDEIFDAKLVPFLKKLKEEAGKQISAEHRAGNISQKRIGEFKKEVLKSFYEDASLRDIFVKYFKAYEDRTKEKIAGKKERLGIRTVDDKAAFFDEWYAGFPDWGEGYGRALASGENSLLLDHIAKDCKEIGKKDFEGTLSKFENPDNIVIFVTDSIGFWQYFEDSKNFRPKWHRATEQLEIKAFGGWYDFNGHSIPVFETYYGRIDKQILIFDKAKIGQLIQLSPLNEEEDPSSVEDIFYIDIKAFSKDTQLMEEFIKNPPGWLKKIGDEQKQREYLQERVHIQILERFEYSKPEHFEGYKLIS